MNLSQKCWIWFNTVGVGTYRFLAPGQPPGSEQTALYQSDYSIGTGTTTVFLNSSDDFNAVKSVIEVSAGSTRALHQVYTMHDQGDVYTQPSPFISVGSTSLSDSLSGLGSLMVNSMVINSNLSLFQILHIQNWNSGSFIKSLHVWPIRHT